jgi:hypothetical protein
VALDGREVHIYPDPAAPNPSLIFQGAGMRSVNALAPAETDALLVTDGSATRKVDEWAWDLMERGRSGRALRFDLKTKEITELASNLRYAFGACAIGWLRHHF